MNKKIEITLNEFPGFYESILSNTIEEINENENQINFPKTHENIAKSYFNIWHDINLEIFNNIGIIEIGYLYLDEPKYYNYRTDIIGLSVEFNKDKFINYVLSNINKKDFELYLKDNFTLRDGFIPFYSNNIEEWLEKLLYKVEEDNIIFETFLNMFIKDNTKDVIWDVVELIYENIVYEENIELN